MCPGEHFVLYCAMMFVMVDRSGHVCVDNQLRLPAYSWRSLFNLARWSSGRSKSGTLSTGKPLRYGVLAESDCGVSRPAFEMRS